MRKVLFAFATLLVALLSGPAAAGGDLRWEAWTRDVFAKAKAENRFVLLDLEAVWCHWCHVMAGTTYRDPKVVDLLGSKYLTIRVDQDAHPDLSNRYGDWGWPATIIFAPDGQELVKRRGYIPPENMASLLQAVIDDPTPGPSVTDEAIVAPAPTHRLDRRQRDELVSELTQAYDRQYGGWGDGHKLIDADSMDWALGEAERGNRDAAAMARQTLDAALALIDQGGGGIFQYSDEPDWTSPHYEKIMWFQSQALRQYSAAYALWREPRYLAAGRNIYRYLATDLTAPSGAFFTSQDADVDGRLDGKAFYALSPSERRALGRHPRIDTNIYARENGWAISGLVALYNVTGDAGVLERAERAASWVIASRGIAGGGFRHGAADRGGPFLGDTLAMGQALLDLYAATGTRSWLTRAIAAGDYVAGSFLDQSGGFVTTVSSEADIGVFSSRFKLLDEQIQMARFANRLHRHTGSPDHLAMAEHAGRYITSETVIEQPRARSGVLVADRELAVEPTHITIVGAKADPSAIALHAAARAYPALYKRLDWWDRAEGALPNPDVDYPELDRAAAFACTDRICSLPAFTDDELTATVGRMLASSHRERTP